MRREQNEGIRARPAGCSSAARSALLFYLLFISSPGPSSDSQLCTSTHTSCSHVFLRPQVLRVGQAEAHVQGRRVCQVSAADMLPAPMPLCPDAPRPRQQLCPSESQPVVELNPQAQPSNSAQRLVLQHAAIQFRQFSSQIELTLILQRAEQQSSSPIQSRARRPQTPRWIGPLARLDRCRLDERKSICTFAASHSCFRGRANMSSGAWLCRRSRFVGQFGSGSTRGRR